MSNATTEVSSFLTKAHTMNAAFTKDLLLHSPIEQSIMLVGDHGVGKDGIIKEAAMELNCPVIDIRLSQNDVGDIKGMPIQVKGRTLFAPPDWMPLEHENYENIGELLDDISTRAAKMASSDTGFLFLNELNRASREVQQVVMEICLDRTMGMRQVKKGWRIVSAINGDEHYITTILDLALKSRFRLVRFKPSVEEWLEWAVRMELHPAIIEFIRRFNTMLDPSDKLLREGAANIDVQVRNRRAWEMFSDDIKYRLNLYDEGKVSDPLAKDKDALGLLQMRAMTYMDTIAAMDFCSFLMTDYETLSGEIILNKWDKDVAKKVKDVVKGNRLVELSRYSDMIVETIGTSILTKDQKDNLTSYCKLLNRESRVCLFKRYMHESKKSCLDWYEDKGVRTLMTEALMDKEITPA